LTKVFVDFDEDLRHHGSVMSRRALPTTAELQILDVLWGDGPATVREVNNRLRERGGSDVGYSTTLKLMQIMLEKGLVQRDDSVRPQLYRAASARDVTERQLLRDVRDRAFGGSLTRLVMRALDTEDVSPAERRRIEAMLQRAEKERS
jgi:predicted transcriptional regulator